MNKKIIKPICLTILIIFIIFLLIYFYPFFSSLMTEEGRKSFEEFITHTGLIGILVLFLIQFLQIFLFIIPGEPIEILAGMCFGGFFGTVFILISTLIISNFIFYLVRKYGKKFVYKFNNKKQVQRIINSKLFKDEKKIEFVMLLIFLIPGTPKDLFVYLAALLPIKKKRFLLISTVARIPSVVSSTIIGSNLLSGSWQIGLLLYGGIFLIVLLIIFIINKYDKNKITNKILVLLKKK